MKTFYLFLLQIVMAVSLHAQDDIIKRLERRAPGEGTVTVHQDPRIRSLLGSSRSETSVTGERKVLKAIGYRVQVYAGNNSRRAREEALGVAARVKESFPHLPVYTHFSSPRWLCRVGDFKSIEEADAMMRKLKGTGIFKEVSIVREQINIPL